MGCASSKQPVCRKCRIPAARSYSMHVYHPPEREGDTYHVVSLTSTTLGSLNLNSIQHQHQHHKNQEQVTVVDDDDGDDDKRSNAKAWSGMIKEKIPKAPIDSTEQDHHKTLEKVTVPIEDDDDDGLEKRSKGFKMGLIEAKTWSEMIDQKIPKMVPKTPIATPPGEPETINAWELMEGLDDTSPLRPTHQHRRSFSFHVDPNSISSPCHHGQKIGESDRELHSNSNATSVEFDPDVISTFRKALEDLPPTNPFCLKQLQSEEKQGKDRVVLYFTSLRGVRKTYEDCCHVRVILRGIGVRIDERDVSMHSGFKEEMRELLGDGFCSDGLPRVFVGKKYIGGAEEIWRMHEEGRLEKVLDCCEMVDCGGGGVCEGCGDGRFVPCETCSGSCKIYYEDDYDNDEDECDERECGFQRCPDCNENGIVRCPICCD